LTFRRRNSDNQWPRVPRLWVPHSSTERFI